jgi:adenosylmethionine-8-amino-7-oxononanoate aminotransferase
MDLSARDRKVVWHPFSQHGLNQALLPVESAKGAHLKLSDGREILDAISSWWVNIHGHSHPSVVEAIRKQGSTLEHVIFAGFTHEPAVQLAETLVAYPSIQNAGLSKVFYSDNGSTAVEVALKMSFQYHLNRGISGRNKFLALRNSYHGDTLGAMAVGEPDGYHNHFRRLMPDVDFVEPDQIQQLEQLLTQNGNAYAAFIFEPLLQGAGGMKLYSSSYLKEAVALCKKFGILTIADEIFTGFYRTGKCFAFEHAEIKPDLVCLSKGITAGFLPLAVTLTTEDIFQAFVSKEIRTAFLHGHSYTANPISCAAAIESWRLLQDPACLQKIQMIEQRTRKWIEELKSHPRVQAARCIGTVGAIEIRSGENYFSPKPGALMERAIAKGVLLRPLGNVLYAVPPYCCTSEEIDLIYRIMKEVLEE